MLMEAAAWAAIVAVPIGLAALAAPFVTVVAGRQRKLRQRLREILFPVVKACDQYYSGDKSVLTPQFIKETGDQLLELSKRDGLKAPNSFVIGQLWESLDKIPGNMNIKKLLPFDVFPPEYSADLLKRNADHLEAQALRAGAQAAVLIRATHAIDNFDYRAYRQMKWHGGEEGWAHFRLPGRKNESN